MTKTEGNTSPSSVASGHERLVEIGESVRPRYVWSVIVAFLVGVATMAAFNLWANLWGNYGDRGILTIVNDRRGKVEQLLALAPEASPEAYIIGSSTAYPYQPASIESRFGYRAYNLGNFWARMPNMYCWLQFVLNEMPERPKIVLLHLDTWTFARETAGPPLFPHLRRRFLNSPQLVQYLGEVDPVSDVLWRALDLFSWQAFRDGVKQVWLGNRPEDWTPLTENPHREYRSDGSGPYSNVLPSFAPADVNEFYQGLIDGTSPDDASAARTREKLRRRSIVPRSEVANFFSGESFDPHAVELLHRFLEDAADERIRVVIILAPVHPYFEDLLMAHTEHGRFRGALRRLAHDAVDGYGGFHEVVDATDLRRFGGRAFDFYDPLHMKPANADRVLDLVARSTTAK